MKYIDWKIFIIINLMTISITMLLTCLGGSINSQFFYLDNFTIFCIHISLVMLFHCIYLAIENLMDVYIKKIKNKDEQEK